MSETTLELTAPDGQSIFAYRWAPGGGTPKAIVQIAHGMGEHAARYRRLAEALVDNGYVVYANDHRGHGHTAGGDENLGDFGPGGWQGLVDDLGVVSARARADHPGLPLVIVGHSMGSFALQHYLLFHGADLDGAVLSGTTAIDVIAAGIDPSQPADLTAFNEPFQPARTDFDWLSRDTDEVDLYVNDAWCGFGVDPKGMEGMLGAASLAADPERLGAIPKDLPIYLFSGTADPIAGGGDLINLVADRYRQAGVTDVTVDLYPDARHEALNETNRDEVTANLVAWLDRVTAQPRSPARA